MGFDVIYGKVADSIKQSNFVERVKNYFGQAGDEGTLYLGYSLTANIEGMQMADALLIGKNCGVVAFDFPEQSVKDLQKIYDGQEKLFGDLGFYFRMFPTLRSRWGELFFKYRVVSIVPAVDFDFDKDYFITTTDNLPQFLSAGEKLSDASYSRICESLQKVTGMKPAKDRLNVTNVNSMGGKLKQIEKQIANLDTWQQKAAMEITDGPQRIRGLAGSGKTIILAWKAAYLHANYPDWDIAVTFFSRSLYQQFKDLITRFHSLHSRDPINWNKLRVLHAWGGYTKPGLYYVAANTLGVSSVNHKEAKARYGFDNAFKGICDDLLEKFTEEKPIFDAVLIDEAQDLPISFFKIVYKLTKMPKRITWAYDELQNIKNVSMPPAESMFGISDEDKSSFSLDNLDGEPMRDILLKICYRNPMWSLAVAHALGFGIYRKPTDKNVGLVQMFDDPEMWEDIGYQCIDGELDAGAQVTLKRRKDATPSYFEELLTPQSSLQFQKFDSFDEQYSWIADEIHKNITEDELDPDDVLVIFAAKNTSSVESDYVNFQKFLRAKKIESILAKEDSFRENGKITCSHIYRAKGNEAPMVYIINADNCVSEFVGYRNIIFTAITRSRAWVRILGVGAKMDTLIEEIATCVRNDYALKFKYPTKEELEKIRAILFDTKKNKRSKGDAVILAHIRSLMETENWTAKQAMDALKIPINKQKKYIKLI